MINIHDYTKIENLGSGASGEVYLVKDKDETEFAAKISFSILKQNTDNALMLVREVNSLAALRHPVIVQYIGFSEFDFNDERKPVIVTEYARNRSLSHIIDNERRATAPHEWDITQKFIVIYGIAAGMQHCHKHDLIHRDLKPSNILMNDNLFPLIADFGLCKRIHHNFDSITMQSQSGLKGTYSYMAPEVWRKNGDSKEADVYAFAMIVYEIMTTEIPFPFPDIEIKQKVLSGERPSFPYQLPECYMDLIQRCWADDPKQRMTFDEVVTLLKENPEFRQIDLFEEDRFLDYCDYIDAAVKSFDANKKVLDFYQFMAGRGKTVQSIILPPPKKTFANLFGLLSPTPKIIYPSDKFALLKPECQHLIERAVTNPNAQFLVGQKSIEGIGGFPISIEIGIKYLKESISNRCLDSVAYYSQILIKGEIVPQDTKAAQKYLGDNLSANDARIDCLYAKVMKIQNQFKDALKYFKKAASEGNAESMYECSQFLFKSDFQQSIDYLKMAQRNGNSKSIKFLTSYEGLKNNDFFTRLPLESQQFFVILFSNSSNEERRSIQLNTQDLLKLLSNHSLDSPDIIPMLQMFDEVKIDIIYTEASKNYDTLIYKIMRIKQKIPNLYVHLNLSDLKKLKTPFGPNEVINEITFCPFATYFGNSVFSVFEQLTNISLPPTLTTIEPYVFQYCSALAQVKLPNSLTYIPRGMFLACISLRSITIHHSVTSIGPNAFQRCLNLYEVTIQSNTLYLSETSFLECPQFSQLDANESIVRTFYQIGSLLKSTNYDYPINNQLAEVSRMYKVSASARLKEAMYEYGRMLFNGDGIPINKREGNRYYKMAAELGYIDAIKQYAHNLIEGVGIEKNLEEATQLYRKGAQLNDVDCIFQYGYHLDYGIGIKVDKAQAKDYYKIAADKGHITGMNNYAIFMEYGYGTQINYNEASRYYKMAADNNFLNAMNSYACMLEDGRGVTQNLSEACNYYKRAADKGHLLATYNYARMLEKGTGVAKNLEQAKHYYKIAADKGHKEAKERYDYLNSYCLIC